MAGPYETIQIPFTGGLDQKTEAEYLDASQRLLTVTNGQWHAEGGIRKRFGVSSLANAQYPGDPTMGTPLRLATRGTELLRTDGNALFSLSTAAGMWVERGLMPSPLATRDHILASTNGLTGFTMTEGSGFRALIYRTSNGANSTGDICVSLYDSNTGATIIANIKLTTATTFWNPVGHIVGTYLYVFYSDTVATSTVWCRILNLSTMSWTAQASVVTDGLPSLTAPASAISVVPFDATPYTGVGTGILMLYQVNNAGTRSLRYIRLEALPALTISGSAILIIAGESSGNQYRSLCCRYDGTLNRVWFCWTYYFGIGWSSAAWGFDTTFTSLSVNPIPLGALTVNPPLAIAVEVVDASSAIFVQTCALGNTTGFMTTPWIQQATYSNTGTLINSTQYEFCQAITRPFRAAINGVTRVYMVVALQEYSVSQTGTNAPFAASYYLVDTQQGGSQLPRVAATIAPRQGNQPYIANIGALDMKLGCATNIGLPNAGTFRAAVVVNGSGEFASTSALVSSVWVDVAAFDFTGALSWQPAEIAGATVFSGGAPGYYDRAGVQELSFFSWPMFEQSPPVGIVTSGGFIAAGTYGYAFIHSQLDGNGLAHRSAAITTSVTFGSANSRIGFVFNNIPFTSRYNGNRSVLIEIYRTQASGSIYYYVGSAVCDPSSNSDTVSFTDTLADASIVTNSTLYTTGGVLDSVCPPSMRCITAHNQRLWGIDDTGYVIWFSTAVNGADFPYFNEGLTLVFPEQLTALLELDDKLIAFSRTRPYLLTGDGPPLTGQGSDLSNAIPIVSDVGAADWRSVVAFPGGILFQAPSSGIYQLGRDLQVTSVGKGVQDLTAGLSVVSAQLVASQNVVRFLMSDGSVLNYDYVMRDASGTGRWSGASYAYPMIAAGSLQGTWVAGSSDGNVYQENTAASVKPYYDAKAGVYTWVTLTIATAWVKQQLQSWMQFGPVQGYGPWLDPCDVQVQLQFDYGLGSQSHTFPHSNLSAANAFAAQWDLTPNASLSTAQAMKVTLSDAAAADSTSSSGQGLRWLGVAIDVQPLSGRNLNLSTLQKA